MKHQWGPIYEPVGGHGMNYRRQCQVCGETIIVLSANEDPDAAAATECKVASAESLEVQDVAGNAKVAPDGPFKIQVQFGIRSMAEDKDGNFEIGYAKVIMPIGMIPTEESISEAAISALNQLSAQGYRYLTRQEFANLLAHESTSQEDATMAMNGLTFKLDVFA